MSEVKRTADQLMAMRHTWNSLRGSESRKELIYKLDRAQVEIDHWRIAYSDHLAQIAALEARLEHEKVGAKSVNDAWLEITKSRDATITACQEKIAALEAERDALRDRVSKLESAITLALGGLNAPYDYAKNILKETITKKAQL